MRFYGVEFSEIDASMESDDESVTPTFPSLTSISLGDTKYYGGSFDIVTTSGQSFSNWTGFRFMQKCHLE